MTRACDQCGKHLVSHRQGARFCDDECKNAWHNEQRRRCAGTDKRLNGQTSGVGSRGGNVRDLNEARGLQEEQKEKARWTLIVREHIARTLLDTGYFHADDLTDLGVPGQHCNIRGSQTAAFVAKGWMKKVGERKCEHRAANARKAAIYKVTDEGLANLRSLLGGVDPRRGSAWKPTDKCQCGCDKPIHRAGVRFLPGHWNRENEVDYAIDPLTGCWIWQRQIADNGYGRKNIRLPDGSEKAQTAHRFYYELHCGAIPDGLHIDHLCRNRECVNPDHLEPVTPAENNRRMEGVKLSVDDVATIRASGETNMALAQKYGVSNSHISEIRSGKKWAGSGDKGNVGHRAGGHRSALGGGDTPSSLSAPSSVPGEPSLSPAGSEETPAGESPGSEAVPLFEEEHRALNPLRDREAA